jgi:Acyl-CoA carboxylase epsilon subunit
MSSDQEMEFTVVKGSPTEDELAAVVTVLTTQFMSPQSGQAKPAQSGWSAYWRSLRSPIQPGPRAWRMSGRPQ